MILRVLKSYSTIQTFQVASYRQFYTFEKMLKQHLNLPINNRLFSLVIPEAVDKADDPTLGPLSDLSTLRG